MTPIDSQCVVCNVKFKISLPKKDSGLPILHRNFDIFCSFFLPEKEKMNTKIDTTLWSAFSFCSSCLVTVASLCSFQHQLEFIQKEIKTIITHITKNIVNSTTTRIAQNNPHQVVSNRLKLVETVICTYYKPRVVLTSCDDDHVENSSSVGDEFQDYDLKEEPLSPGSIDDDPLSPFQDEEVDNNINLSFPSNQELFHNENDDDDPLPSKKSPVIKSLPVIKKVKKIIKSKLSSPNKKVQKSKVLPEKQVENLMQTTTTRTTRSSATAALNKIKLAIKRPRFEDGLESGEDDDDSLDERKDEATPALRQKSKSQIEEDLETFKVIPTKTQGQFQYGNWKFEQVVENEKTLFKCLECGTTTNTQKILISHIHFQHIILKKKTVVNPPVDDNLYVKMDKDGIYHYNGFTFEKTDKGLKCGTCDFVNIYRKTMIHHINKFHNTEKPVCTVCDNIFTSEEVLKEHQCRQKKVTLGNRRFIHLSGGEYLYRGEWKVSKVEENGVIVGFQCLTCQVIKRTHEAAAAHIRQTHMEGEQFVCEVCGYSAISPSRLRSHQVSHLTERNFICEYCSQSFKTSTCLNNHKEKHEQNCFQCLDCDKTYVYRVSLHRHCKSTGHKVEKLDKRIKESVTSFECPKCKSIHRTQTALDKHMTNCEGRNAFLCLICGHLSTHSELLENHMKTHHGQPEEVTPVIPESHKEIVEPEKSVENYVDSVVRENDQLMSPIEFDNFKW